MILRSPCQITPRLLPGVQIGDAWVSIEYSDQYGNGVRTRYRWYIDVDGETFTGDDLESCRPSLQYGLTSLLSFLSAFAEAQGYPGSENVDLFDLRLAPFATQYSDEITMMSCWLEETENLIEE